MNRSRWIAAGVVVLIAVVGVVWLRSRPSNAAPKFRTAAVERGTVESVVSATGTVTPVIQVEVGSQVSGTLKRINADYNSKVRKGQILCEIDPSSFRARVVQSEAAVAKAEAALKDGRRVLDRAGELRRQDYISQAEVDAAELAVEQRNAELLQARAQLEVSRVDFANTVIRAPIDGVVIARSIELGQTVAASLQAPKLFVIANDLSEMKVETKIDEADIGRIRPGLAVTFTVDAFPDQEFSGEVAQVRLEPIVEQNVVTYTTVIRTRNPQLKLRPGMTANVTVRVARRDEVMKIPAAALRFRPPQEQRAHGVAIAAGAAERGRPSGAMVRKGAGPKGAASGERVAMGEGRPMGKGGGAIRESAGDRAKAGIGDADAASTDDPLAMPKPGRLYVLRASGPTPIEVVTGLSDGSFVEVVSGELREGDQVLVGLEMPRQAGNNLQPPPGMGGPRFQGPGGRGGGGGRR